MRAHFFFDSLTLKSDQHLICSQNIIVPNVKVLIIKEIVITVVLIFLGKSASPYYKNSSENGKENV